MKTANHNSGPNGPTLPILRPCQTFAHFASYYRQRYMDQCLWGFLLKRPCHETGRRTKAKYDIFRKLFKIFSSNLKTSAKLVRLAFELVLKIACDYFLYFQVICVDVQDVSITKFKKLESSPAAIFFSLNLIFECKWQTDLLVNKNAQFDRFPPPLPALITQLYGGKIIWIPPPPTIIPIHTKKITFPNLPIFKPIPMPRKRNYM